MKAKGRGLCLRCCLLHSAWGLTMVKIVKDEEVKP